MRIARVDVVPFEPRFPGEGYFMSHVVQKVLHTRMIRLVSEDGAWGVGEIVRKSKNDPVASTKAEDARLPALDGLALAELPELLAAWRADGEYPAAFGVELAMLDLMSRSTGQPLSSVLGGPPTGSVRAYLSLSSGEPADMAQTVRTRPGHYVVQAKLGIGDIDTDMRRVEAVLAAMSPDQILLADFNGALDPETALEALPAIQDDRLTWEDPCFTFDDNTRVARALAAPVMFDMCMNGLPEFLRAIAGRHAASVTIKPPFVGGLSVARTARDLCLSAGLPMRIDGPWSGPVAAASAIHLALGAPDALLICSADLTDPFEFETDMIRHPRPGHVSVAPGAGLGDVPDGLFGPLQ